MAALSGRTFLVTGGNTGIGLATAQALAAQGGRVHIACRSEQKGAAAVAAIAAATGSDQVAFLQLDLADLGSVRAAASVLGVSEPAVSQAITAFKTAVASSTSIQSALLNPDVQKVLLTANGLSNYIGETALVQKVLLSDPTDSNSLVNQMGDSSLLSTVQTYNFAQNGLAELQNPTVISTLTNAYAEVQWRQSLDAATPGLANALSFLSSASSIKSFNDIIGNETNFEVITTALGIPENILNQDMTAQESAISSRLNYAQLQDPNYVTSLTDQYLINQQENSQSSSAGISGLLV